MQFWNWILDLVNKGFGNAQIAPGFVKVTATTAITKEKIVALGALTADTVHPAAAHAGLTDLTVPLYVAIADIPASGYGYVAPALVISADTTGAAVGDPVYLAASGGYSLTAKGRKIGMVIVANSTSGKIYLAPQNTAITQSTVYRAFLPLTTTTRTASLVLLDVTGSSVTLQPGTYRVRAFLRVTSPAAADIDFSWNFSGTGTFVWGWVGDASGTASKALTTEYTVATTGAADDLMIAEGSLIVTVAGDFKLQFAQNVSDPGNTSVNTGSFIDIERVA